MLHRHVHTYTDAQLIGTSGHTRSSFNQLFNPHRSAKIIHVRTFHARSLPQLNATIHHLTEQARQRELSLRRREIATRAAEVDIKSLSDANTALKAAIAKQSYEGKARHEAQRLALATTLEAARERESKARHPPPTDENPGSQGGYPFGDAQH